MHKPRPSLSAAGFTALALVGTWLGHTAEYLRAGGKDGLWRGLVDPAHMYMLPLGVTLFILSSVFGALIWKAWSRLSLRLDELRSLLRGHRRGSVDLLPSSPLTIPHFLAVQWGRLWIALLTMQLVIFLSQENIEASISGDQLPGLDALTRAHGSPLLVHAALALTLTCLLVAIRRAIHRRVIAVRVCEAILRVFTWRRAKHTLFQPREAWQSSPLERFGEQLYRRPPPSTHFSPLFQLTHS